MEKQTVTREVVLRNKWGLHARPAAKLAQEAQRFDCEIKVWMDGYEVNAKSILEVLSLAASQGARLHFTAKGEDAENALDYLAGLISNRFYEETQA